MKIFNPQFATLFLLAFLLFPACAADSTNKIDLTQAPLHVNKMVGKWKVNGADEFEVWYPSDGFPIKGALFAGANNKKDDSL